MGIMRLQIVWILFIALSSGISIEIRDRNQQQDSYVGYGQGRRLGYGNEFDRSNQFVGYSPGAQVAYGYKGNYDNEEIAYMGNEGDSIRVSLGYGDGQSYQKTIMITQEIPEPTSEVNKIGVPVQRAIEYPERRTYTVPSEDSYTAPVQNTAPYQEYKKVPFRIYVPSTVPESQPAPVYKNVPEYVQRRNHKRRSSCSYGPR